LEFSFNGADLATDGNQIYAKGTFFGKESENLCKELFGQVAAEEGAPLACKISFNAKPGIVVENFFTKLSAANVWNDLPPFVGKPKFTVVG
jgi:hypothetical protein